MQKVFERPARNVIGILVFVILLASAFTGYIVEVLMLLFPLILVYNYMFIRSVETGKIYPPKTLEIISNLFWKSLMIKYFKFALLITLIGYMGFVAMILNNAFI